MSPPPPEPHPTRALFLREAIQLMHTPYLWGGRTKTGVDCWGMVALAYREAGGSPRLLQWWTDVAWNTLEETKEPEQGVLAFYGGNGPKDVSHVMLCLCDGLVMGGCGGDETTKTVIEAYRRRASVKVYDSLETYNRMRGDFRGFRRLPLK
jgi:cell wall-associated NlpC family hydrolase